MIVEKLVRITIFLANLWLVSRMKELRRVFESRRLRAGDARYGSSRSPSVIVSS